MSVFNPLAADFSANKFIHSRRHFLLYEGMNDEATTVDDDHLIIHFGVVMHFICFIIYYNI